MTLLSAHFSLDEFTHSEMAVRKGYDNTPPAAVIAALRHNADMMEQVRALLGSKVITISSGYRSPRVNAAVGGSKTSDHQKGDATDFNCFAFGSPYQVCKRLKGRLPYDQLIHEFGRWTHISWGPRRRGEELTICKRGGKTVTLVGIHPV